MKLVFTTLLLIVALIGGIVGFVVVQAGGLRQLLEHELSKVSPMVSAEVGAARFTFSMSSTPLSVFAQDITFSFGDDAVIVPEGEVKFGFKSLWTGVPVALNLRGMEIHLVKSAMGWSGSQSTAFLKALLGTADDEASNLATEAATEKAPITFSGVQYISVETDLVTVSDATSMLAPVQLTGIYIDARLDEAGQIMGGIRGQRLINDADAGRLAITFSGLPNSEDFTTDITADDLNLEDIAEYLDIAMVRQSHFGTLSGFLKVQMSQSTITSVFGDVTVSDGYISQIAEKKRGAFKTAEIGFTYLSHIDVATVSNAQILLDDGRSFTFSGDVEKLSSATPILSGKIDANSVRLQSIFEDWPDDLAPEIKAQLQSQFSGGVVSNLGAEFNGSFNRETSILKLLKLDMTTKFDSVRANLSAGQIRRIVGTVDGGMDINIGVGGEVLNANVMLNLNNGSMLLEDIAKSVPVRKAALKMTLRKGDLVVDGFEADFAEGGAINLSGNIFIAPDWTPLNFGMNLEASNLDARFFQALWPQWAMTKTRDWMQSNILAGQIDNARISMAGVFPAGSQKPVLSNLSATGSYKDATVRWASTMPLMSGVDAELVLDNTVLNITTSSGQLEDFELDSGRVTIDPVLTEGPRTVDVSLQAQGGLPAALDIFKRTGRTKVGAIDLEKMTVSGVTELTLTSRFPLRKGTKFADAETTVNATTRNATIKGLPFGIDLKATTMIASFEKNKVDITGDARVFDMPASFTFQTNAATREVDFVGQFESSPIMSDIFARMSGLDIAGNASAKIGFSSSTGWNNAEINLSTNLTDASINVPILNWAKFPAEEGFVNASFVLNNGVITAVKDIDLSLGTLIAEGQLALGVDGSLQAAFFNKLTMPGNDIRDLIIETSDNGGWNVSAAARTIDLVPLRRNKGVGGGAPITFDVTADTIFIDAQNSLSGHLQGSRDDAGNGQAVFSGTLLAKGKPLVSEGQMTVDFGPKGDQLRGAGLIGGAETQISFHGNGGEQAVLVLTSKNAGRMLSGLGVTDAIRSGSIRLENDFISDDFSSFNTNITVSNFKVVEAPRAVRIFSLLGPAGIIGLVEGEGTAFSNGAARFEKRGDDISISRMEASGGAVSVAIVGRFNKQKRDMDIAGNVVPANQLSKLVGAVPLLGNVLTGIDKSGIFTTQFSMVGDIDDPKTTINASSLAPGVLRDLFSPEWLKRESDRLFGAETD
ncbi:AsmA-like C-terminal domain-containing protein [Alphaproteobacteria bacterium]|nr:AsmA-like C-terminal domain-containing protein [Alphaproteobacteria bacterium]